jgi:hypothetical protein
VRTSLAKGDRGFGRFFERLARDAAARGDEGDGDLDAHGILGGAEKAGDRKDLLDPAKAQLDRPALLMKRGDLLRGGVEVVRQQPQHLADLGENAHLAHRVLHRIAAAVGLARGQEADAVGKKVAAFRHRQLFHHSERRVGFEAGDDRALRGVKLGPPSIIVIAEIKNIGGARFDRHLLSHGDVVDVCRAHRGVDRAIGMGIVDDMHLGAGHPGRKAETCSRNACGSCLWPLSHARCRSIR